MDADYTKRRRDSEKSRREKRWSMNSQRLEEIVAELMKPISDVRRSFDTDLSALLEEYLTEAGLHALEADEEAAAPNFAELALLLQQSASIYSRKVDFLYQHVINVSDSLHNSTLEVSGEAGAGEAVAAGAAAAGGTPSARRKRKGSALAPGAFLPIEVEACAGARREASSARPPPTLPRMYIELEPRVLADADAPLLDYAGEPIGLLADFQVAWRLRGGLLVDELEGGCAGRSMLRAVPLVELQAAIASAAPPTPPPAASPAPLLSSPGPPFSSPGPPFSPGPPVSSPGPPMSSPGPPVSSPGPPVFSPGPPLSAGLEPAACSTPLPPPVKKERKRRSDVRLEDLADGAIKLLISQELRQKLEEVEEFSIPQAWVSRVVRARKGRVLRERRRLRDLDLALPTKDFRGFDISDSTDIGGFAGWETSEGAAAAAEAAAAGAAARRAHRPDDSDDDGFFERSSLGDSDDSALHHPHHPEQAQAATGPAAGAGAGAEQGAEWVAWREAVLARASAGEARAGAGDARAAGRALLRAVRALPGPVPCDVVLAAAAHHSADVSRVFLATLFLANAGNLEVVPGPPLTLNSFSVRFVSDEERLQPAR